MKNKLLLIICFLFWTTPFFAQEVYILDTTYPVHDLNPILKVYKETHEGFTPEFILNEKDLNFARGDELPIHLKPGTTYWGKFMIQAIDTLSGWTLHFEDKMIGPPAWTKSNGKVDVYGFVNNLLIFHKKTGVEYKRKERDLGGNWVLNRISLDSLPINIPISVIIKAQGSSFGYPAYFNLSARSPQQPYYHQIYQFHNSFNIFMFGVTFIIFLYHFLQFLYTKDKIYFWFSLWLFFCMLNQAMSIGMIIGSLTSFRYPIWFFTVHSFFYVFWFFGRSFIDSKKKFPVLDKYILGLALFILAEIVLMTLYVVLFNPKISFLGPKIHYLLLNLFTIGSLVISVILTLKKDLFARYFGIGSLIGSLFLIIGTLWSMDLINPPFRLDPYVTGMFLQIVIYSFGIAYRRQKMNEQNQIERLNAERTMSEVQRMKDLDEVKSRFFANISHEFRTPLALINGPLQQAKKQTANKIGNTITLSDKSYTLIQKNTNRLQILVDQLLELAKIESGKLQLNLTNGGLVKFIRTQVFSFESMAERQNISLNTHFPEEPEEAYYDKDKLEKILNNLLSNAFKFTPSGGAINVEVTIIKKNLQIEISDTGKGIQKQEIDRIFDRFYRVEGSEAKGSGIGLALTKELIDLCNGQINVHSIKGRGTTFKVRLPLTIAELPNSLVIKKEEAPTKNDDQINLNGKDQNSSTNIVLKNHENLVLLIEDNVDLQNFISEILHDHYKVLTADDGLQGERMAFEHIPDLIISDIMMPKKDGLEVCHNLKINIKTSHIPIIMLTAKAGHSNKIEGLTQGADAYLTKPFDADELLLRIKNLIDSRKKMWQHFNSLNTAVIDNLDLKSVDDKFLQKVVKTVKDNLDNDLLSIEDIASKVGFSRAQ
ncbi:MAG: response regulator, partial [Bacteroidia bacterium]|nr:response regulator [Bacteroidia bacterium]